MQIDFHESKTKLPTRRTQKELKVPVALKRIVGLVVAIVGIIFILFSVLSLALTKSDTPYAVMVFEQKEKGSPQTHAHIVWVNEAKGTAQITQIPDPLEFHSQSLGTYPIESIYAAHLTTKQPNSDFLTDMSFFFRFPIKSFFYSTKAVEPSKGGLSTLALRSCLAGTSSMSFGECIHMTLFLSSFGTTIRELTFPQSALGTGSLETIKPLDRTKYREWSQTHFSESFKSFNKYTVAVLNGTQTSGLATYAANIVSDFGLTVLYIGETQTPQPSGEIVISKNASQNPAMQSFFQAALQLPVRIDDTLPTRYRSDIVVVIGEKEAKFFEP